ncbi:MAG: HK97 family phage prohead protease, partial [Kordiimonadaceae bacterium]|nr:HK97 family phage prohead protease [Kordiimonadaceae bacterium]
MADVERAGQVDGGLSIEIKSDGDDLGTFSGYGSIFGNKDRDGDIVAKGAFKKSLGKALPALLWQHDQKEPIGRFDEVREDEKGLFVRGRLVLQGRGLQAYELLKVGALKGLSIGFVTKEASR